MSFAGTSANMLRRCPKHGNSVGSSRFVFRFQLKSKHHFPRNLINLERLLFSGACVNQCMLFISPLSGFQAISCNSHVYFLLFEVMVAILILVTLGTNQAAYIHSVCAVLNILQLFISDGGFHDLSYLSSLS
jgi:hypothetical protein